ncbi:pyridoxamine 5'-phosphate oxidase family protein [Roseateles sp. LYH14W]|uniref:Pyridoxamine 5'-phosphate oxidase family protein n=1 Tax=Pelomonas parva TaxID=3299032 RepID=A0ABW7EYN3_9BURK
MFHGLGFLSWPSPDHRKEPELAATTFDAAHVIQDEAALAALFEPTHALAVQKSRDSLGPHAQAFIRRSPLLCIGTQHRDGRADVSPRGDPAGFVRVLDDRTLAIPDRPGNNRLDSLRNILANPSVGLLFIIPGFDETLRVNGQATLVTEPELLRSMSIQQRTPSLAILVHVTEVFLHCAKAFRRAHLWSDEQRQARSGMPSLMKMILDDTTGAPDDAELCRLDEALEDAYRKTLY